MLCCAPASPGHPRAMLIRSTAPHRMPMPMPIPNMHAVHRLPTPFIPRSHARPPARSPALLPACRLRPGHSLPGAEPGSTTPTWSVTSLVALWVRTGNGNPSFWIPNVPLTSGRLAVKWAFPLPRQRRCTLTRRFHCCDCDWVSLCPEPTELRSVMQHLLRPWNKTCIYCTRQRRPRTPGTAPPPKTTFLQSRPSNGYFARRHNRHPLQPQGHGL